MTLWRDDRYVGYESLVLEAGDDEKVCRPESTVLSRAQKSAFGLFLLSISFNQRYIAAATLFSLSRASCADH